MNYIRAIVIITAFGCVVEGNNTTIMKAMSNYACKKTTKQVTEMMEIPLEGIIQCAKKCLETNNCKSIIVPDNIATTCKLFESNFMSENMIKRAFCDLSEMPKENVCHITKTLKSPKTLQNGCFYNVGIKYLYNSFLKNMIRYKCKAEKLDNSDFWLFRITKCTGEKCCLGILMDADGGSGMVDIRADCQRRTIPSKRKPGQNHHRYDFKLVIMNDKSILCAYIEKTPSTHRRKKPNTVDYGIKYECKKYKNYYKDNTFLIEPLKI